MELLIPKIKSFQYRFVLSFIKFYLIKSFNYNLFLKKSKNIFLIYSQNLILNLFYFIKFNLKLSSNKNVNYWKYNLWSVKKKKNSKRCKNIVNNYILNLYFKIQKLNLFFIEYLLGRKKGFNLIYVKNKNKFLVINRSLKIKNVKELVLLNVTFSKKNTFFNVSKSQGKTMYLTTVNREGYVGRKRVAYTSIFSVASLIKKVISSFYANKYCDICIVYKGWSRFRSAIQSAFNKKIKFNLNIKYIKYIVKIPHNGCKAPKQRNRRKMQKYFVKKLNSY